MAPVSLPLGSSNPSMSCQVRLHGNGTRTICVCMGVEAGLIECLAKSKNEITISDN